MLVQHLHCLKQKEPLVNRSQPYSPCRQYLDCQKQGHSSLSVTSQKGPNSSKYNVPPSYHRSYDTFSQLKRYAEATLGSGNLHRAVILPEGEDVDEWLAVNSKQLVL